MDKQKELKMNSRVIKHLGTDLITNSSVALIELIKNSIDAKADNINILLYDDYQEFKKNNKQNINNEIFEMVPEELLKKSFCIVEDDGMGMDNHTIDNGFLEIGTDIKLNDKDNDTLGEKGIGRLATQRLGTSVLVETASDNENMGSVLFIDWDKVIKNGEKSFIPYNQFGKNSGHYTRLWIFGINISDFLDVPEQLSLVFDRQQIPVNNDLRSAIAFLTSPYSGSKKTKLEMHYNEHNLDISFPKDMLNLSESEHFFKINKDSDNKLSIEYGIELKPWFLERMHRASVKQKAFNRLKKKHIFYADLLEKSRERIDRIAKIKLDENQFLEHLKKELDKAYSNTIRNPEDRENIVNEFSVDIVTQITKICPITGSVYSFKQNNTVGEKIIIESAKEKGLVDKDITLKTLKGFLNDYNGIKLYRGDYRIGFLGDKESDWLKLQQFRTRGQQFYRFDLGNTLGYISINDSQQEYIKEISSRLDINHEGAVSKALKNVLNIIFNKLFYDLNRSINGLVKVILGEEGLLIENLNKQIKNKTKNIKKSIKSTGVLLGYLEEINNKISESMDTKEDSISLDKKFLGSFAHTLDRTITYLKTDEEVKSEAAVLLDEAGDQLKAIEVEAYNNYKLMANGLITESITHELHSVSKTAIDKNILDNFGYLKRYFRENGQIFLFSQYVQPIQNSYNTISQKIESVANLYSILENTFIKKGTRDEFFEQNISEVVNHVGDNLLELDKEKILIECNTKDLVWLVPKGVLVHVFYNLFTNSIYWIDQRRKNAQDDPYYFKNIDDKIVVEHSDKDEIIIYDTGTGILPKVNDILFDALQSGKPIGEGRGMGLYIVKKMLNSFGADIELSDEKNSFGNAYKFVITYDQEEALEIV